MKLIFDNLTEVREFFECFAHGIAPVQAPQPRPQWEMYDAPVSEPSASPGVGEPLVASEGQQTASAEVQESKRKRRTKAEMEADKAAEAARIAHAAQTPAPQPEQPAASPGVGAAEQPVVASPGVGDPADTPAAAMSPAEWIAERAKEIGPLSPIEHLNRCREYIARKGLNAYNETFKVAGLPPNVMAFTPEQAAMHAATVEYADKFGS